jgi:hypothetical protein
MLVHDDIWSTRYIGHKDSNGETIQTIWLYLTASLTLDKGYDGFEILSPIVLSALEPSDGFIKAHVIYIPIVTPQGGSASCGPSSPMLVSSIRMLKAPIEPDPPKIFDAKMLKAAIEPYVKGDMICENGNVCPHQKPYLQPSVPVAPAKDSI